MHLGLRFRPWAVLLVMQVPGLGGCGKAEVASLPGGGGPGGGGPGGASSAGKPPSFVLPDAGTLPPPPAATTPPPQCAEEAHRAEIVPLDLLFLVDASSSMRDVAGMSTKWEVAQSALGSFIRDPSSAGLGVGLQFFPAPKACKDDRDCFPTTVGNGLFCVGYNVCAGSNAPSPAMSCTAPGAFLPVGNTRCPGGTMCVPAGVCSVGGDDCINIGQACPAGGGTCMAGPRACRGLPFGMNECDPASHEKPAVPIGPLPMAQRPLLRELNASTPLGGTPMGPAVRGALATLRAHLAANPGRKAALILASDGLPSAACEMNDIPAVAASMAAAFAGTPSIPTYVIGVFAPLEVMMSQVQLDQLAQAGGSNKAFILAATADLTMRLQEALNQIRGAALACEYRIPAPTAGRIDFSKVNVRYTGSAGPENIPYVERADRCDPTRGGWYYDTAPTTGAPTRILMCDATCRRFKADQGGKVDLLFGCGTQVIN
jgi:hypothetical protein